MGKPPPPSRYLLLSQVCNPPPQDRTLDTLTPHAYTDTPLLTYLINNDISAYLASTFACKLTRSAISVYRRVYKHQYIPQPEGIVTLELLLDS